MKKIIVLGGGGFIGGHLSKKLKNDGNYVRVCDLKRHEYFNQEDFCDEFILGDLTDPNVVSLVIDESFDDISNNLDRLHRVKDVIIDLYNSDLPGFMLAAQEICEYNQQHLSEMRGKVRAEFPERYRKFMIDQGIINE